MSDSPKAAGFSGDDFSTSLIALMEDSTLAIVVFIIWVILFMQLLKPLRTNARGRAKDSSLFISIIAVILAFAGTVMTMVIYLDIKITVFGTAGFSYIQALF